MFLKQKRLTTSKIAIVAMSVLVFNTLRAGELTAPTFNDGQILDKATLDSIFGAVATEVTGNAQDLQQHESDPSAHHPRYTDAEAQAAMGDTKNSNPLNHNRYTDKEAVSAAKEGGAVFFGGNGSGGDVNITSSVDWADAVPANPNYGNITVAAGQTLTVAAGTTIRCSGSFVNNGTINVHTGAVSGIMSSVFSGTTSFGRPASAGDARSAAGWGESALNYNATTISLSGGPGGTRIDRAVAATAFHNFRLGGGGGVESDSSSASGGGLIKIYCAGAITNNGIINANGANGGTGGGGGGGGIIVLASMTSVDNSAGTINANGGNGGNNSNSTGNGGGGGGGIVIFAAPTINAGSNISVAGAAGGTGATSVSGAGAAASAIGGGGGGACGGNGGNGGGITSDIIFGFGSPANGANGAPGYSIQIKANPVSLVY